MNRDETAETALPARIECHYARVLRGLFPFGVIFFVALGVTLLYLSLSTSKNPVPLFLRAFVGLLGLGSFYLAYSGVRL
jgi:hypothetical protein